MTNQDTGGAAPMTDAASGSTASLLSAGTLLRQAREASGLHIAALAVTMKVPVKKLEALESDRLDLLPDAVFARALAGSVCRTLKIDANPVLERLPTSKKVNLTVEARAANEPFNASGHSSSNSSPMSMPKTAIFIALALMVGVALILWVPSSEQDATITESEVVAPVTSAPSPAASEPSANTVEEVVIPWTAPIVPSSDSATPVVPVPVVPNPTAPTPAVPTAVTPATTPVPTSVPVPAVASVNTAPTAAANSVVASTPANSVVAFKARGDTWVEVVDAKGAVQLRRNLTQNEAVSVSGVLPMVVVVGRVDMTDVQVRGQAFDLGKIAVGNVARFEVK